MLRGADRRISMEFYNLADGPYFVCGAGHILVNGIETMNGTRLTEPGTYDICNEGQGAYRKQVVLFKETTTSSCSKPITYQKDIMPIVGYYGPLRGVDDRGKTFDWVTDECFQKLKDAGINLITYIELNFIDEESRQTLLDCLALAEKYDIGIYIQDRRLATVKTDAEIAEILANFVCFDSFKGIDVVDEPMTEYYYEKWTDYTYRPLDKYAPMAKAVNQFCNHIGYVNLFPRIEELGVGNYADDYDRYIEEYIQKTDAKLLSYDYYPFDNQQYSKIQGLRGFFGNLSAIRDKALKYHLPFWMYVQAGSNWGVRTTTVNDTPTKGQLLWIVNTSLAYGAKGIQYFPLIQPAYEAYVDDGTYDYERQGLLGANLAPTIWYEYAKEANAQIMAVDEILLHVESKKILAKGIEAQKDTQVAENSYEILKEIHVTNNEKGAIVGVLENSEILTFYVANYDMEFKQEICLEFKTEAEYQIISAEEKRTGQGNCVLELQAGGGAAVVIRKS